MKKIFFQAAIAAIFLSCASLTPDSIAGTYTGIIPCADCEGIETVITLTSDNRYTIRWRYLGKEPENLFEDSGTFSFDPNVNVITLKDIEPHSGPSFYAVGRNSLTQLDLEGEFIHGQLAENYVLKKN